MNTCTRCADAEAQLDNTLSLLSATTSTSNLLATEYKQAFEEMNDLRARVAVAVEQLQTLELANAALEHTNTELRGQVAELSVQRDTWRAVTQQ